MNKTYLHIWHDIFLRGDMDQLESILSDDVIFHSPVVHSPQKGKAITALYLRAANQVLNSSTFNYVRELEDGQQIFLEFETQIGDIHVNGIDMIEWNKEGQIIDFKVMVRPLKAMQAIHQSMGEQLKKLNSDNNSSS